MLKQTRKRNFINVQLDLRKRLRGGGQKTDGDEGTLDDFERLQDWRADNGTCMASVIPYIWQALAPKQDGSAAGPAVLKQNGDAKVLGYACRLAIIQAIVQGSDESWTPGRS